jgi:nitroreductase
MNRRSRAIYLKEVIYTRRSVREFTTEIVDEILLCHPIDAAVQAPSAVNEQLWSFCVLRDKALLVRISNAAKAHMLRTSQVALVSHHFQETAERSKIQYLLRMVVCAAVSRSLRPSAEKSFMRKPTVPRCMP